MFCPLYLILLMAESNKQGKKKAAEYKRIEKNTDFYNGHVMFGHQL